MRTPKSCYSALPRQPGREFDDNGKSIDSRICFWSIIFGLVVMTLRGPVDLVICFANTCKNIPVGNTDAPTRFLGLCR